jgi:SAM-dependent methyltransferase
MALPFRGATFDTIVCTQVLEHVSAPWMVASEIFRTLVPGGHLIVTAPFSYFLHDEPYDYYRYTAYGVKSLFTQMGFEAVTIRSISGPLTILNEYIQPVFLVLGHILRPTWPIIWEVNKLYNRLLSPFDSWLGRKTKLPTNILAVFQKPIES